MCIEIIILIVSGQFVYTKQNGFEKPENLYKIPQYIMNQTQYILNKGQEEIMVMAPPEPLHSATIRQITPKIKLFWSREHYMKEILSQDEYEERQKIYVICREQVPEINCEEFEEIRQKYGVNWIIINENNQDVINYLDRTNKIEKTLVDGYWLYQY